MKVCFLLAIFASFYLHSEEIKKIENQLENFDYFEFESDKIK